MPLAAFNHAATASCCAIRDDIDESILAGAHILAGTWPKGYLDALPISPDSQNPVLPRELRALGFERCCQGENRIVFIHRSRWCLKAPRARGHEWTSRRELAILADLSADDRGRFAETLSLPGDILLQRRYRVDPLRFERHLVEILREQRRLWITDINESNIGWTQNGAWVFLDWAGKTFVANGAFDPRERILAMRKSLRVAK
jgi:hypothetical protein